MVTPDLWGAISSCILPEHFTTKRRLIWQAICDLHVEHHPNPDLAAVAARLEASNELHMAGGILELIYSCELPCSYTDYRAVCSAMLWTVRDRLRSQDVPGDSLEQHLAKIEDVSARILAMDVALCDETPAALSEWLVSSLSINELDDPRAIHWGLRSLDEFSGPIMPSQLVIIGSRPGDGKSALAAHIAARAARNGQRVLYVSLEMSPRQCHSRLISAEARVNTKNNRRTEDERSAVRMAAMQAARWPITYRSATQINQICAMARQLHTTAGLHLLVVDYIQLVVPSGLPKSAARYEQVGSVSRALKQLVMDLDIVGVAPAQIDRNIQGRPMLKHLRESGSLEQDANKVLLIHFPNNNDTRSAPVAELNIAKDREGPTGTVEARLHLVSTRWEDCERQDYL